MIQLNVECYTRRKTNDSIVLERKNIIDFNADIMRSSKPILYSKSKEM